MDEACFKSSAQSGREDFRAAMAGIVVSHAYASDPEEKNRHSFFG
jgi:hypothetical protein